MSDLTCPSFLLSFAGLEFSFHRIGRAGWADDTVLRSWADAPWRMGDGLLSVACQPEEFVWLGIGNVGATATVVLTALNGSSTRTMSVPPEWQLGWLIGDDSQRWPIGLLGGETANYRLEVNRTYPISPTATHLTLLSPSAWSERFEPLELSSAEAPPPVPLYSRIVRTKGAA